MKTFIECVTVSPLSEATYGEAVELLLSYWPESEHNIVQDLGGSLDTSQLIRNNFIVACLNTQVVVSSWIESTFSDYMFELSWSAVHPEYTHRGINTLMLDHRLGEIRRQAKEDYCVIVSTWDCPLYRSRGFVPGFVDERKHPEGKAIMLARFEVETR